MNLRPLPLQGAHIRLEPVVESLRQDVRRLTEGDPDAWAVLVVNGQGEYFDRYFTAMTETPNRISYAVRLLSTGEIVGTTSYYDISAQHRTLEIGSTYYRPDARGGPVNPEAKWLLLGHAFDSGALRVQFRTDVRNGRSQAALTKMGAVREGVLRRHMITWTGHERDSVIYSVIIDDWPVVRERLDQRLKEYRQ